MEGDADVAVVIPSWNGLDDLRACLRSVADQAEVDVELLVVDNGSTDGTPSWLEATGVPHLSLPQNVGFARAMNLGVRSTRAALITALNADTILESRALARLVSTLRSDHTLGGVQPRILQLDPGGPHDPDRPDAIVYSRGQFITADGRGYERGAGEPQSAAGESTEEIFGVCGAACLLRRELFTELGGYDERYFAFCEDVDLNVRARIAGWRFELEPAAVVWHRGGATWSESLPDPVASNARLVARNRLATQIKFVPTVALPRIAAVEIGALARAARLGRLRATAAGKLEALRWLPALRRDRRALRDSGDLERARTWLGRSSGPVGRGGRSAAAEAP